ncbi:hypothetical protein [Streptomyces sp. NPDC006610]|uniref:hypothetical protein n=1 Tax=Streptomyces sp. NPDC006610 TaxID=3154584 RepID=UPI0033B0E6FB
MSDPSRYYVLLTIDGRPVLHGWWGSEATARSKVSGLIGDYGRPGVRVTLTDEATGETLTEWPSRG